MIRALCERLTLYREFSRPFTLLPPLIGFLSGSVTAYGAPPALENRPLDLPRSSERSWPPP